MTAFQIAGGGRVLSARHPTSPGSFLGGGEGLSARPRAPTGHLLVASGRTARRPAVTKDLPGALDRVPARSGAPGNLFVWSVGSGPEDPDRADVCAPVSRYTGAAAVGTGGTRPTTRATTERVPPRPVVAAGESSRCSQPAPASAQTRPVSGLRLAEIDPTGACSSSSAADAGRRGAGARHLGASCTSSRPVRVTRPTPACWLDVQGAPSPVSQPYVPSGGHPVARGGLQQATTSARPRVGGGLGRPHHQT